MAPASVLIGAVLIGLAAGILAAILRTAAPEAWKLRKPVGCPTCMGSWVTLAFWILASYEPSLVELVPSRGTGLALLQLLASAGIAAWLNNVVVPPPLALPIADDLKFGDADTDKEIDHGSARQ